jgi:hypothetical protein
MPSVQASRVSDSCGKASGELVVQAINIVVYLLLYAGILCLQFSFVERRLRRVRGSAIEARVVLSFLHAVVGLLTFFSVELLLNVVVYSDYRRGVFGWYSNLIPVAGGLFGLLVPWLPLLWRVRNR